MKFATFTERYSRAILFIAVAGCILGILSLKTLPTSIFPQLNIPRIKILADFGDMPPEMVTVQVTKPLEQALASVPNIRRIRSTTSRGSAELTADYNWGTDMLQTLNLVNARLSEVRQSLPPAVVLRTQIMRPTVFPILGFSLTSPQADESRLYDYAFYTLRPELTKIPGVSEVRITGGHVRELWVNLDPSRMQAHGITVTQVEDAVRGSNTVAAVGQYNEAYRRFLVLSKNQITSPADLEGVVVAAKNGVATTIADVGTVGRGYLPQNISVTSGGKNAVLVNVLRQPDGNTVTIEEEVQKTLERLRSSLPAGAKVHFYYDQSDLVRESTHSVAEAILIGGALAAIVLVIFLGNLRSSAVVLSIIPATILITFGLLDLCGQTINIMTMGALAIALGLVVDDAIVVVENVFRHMQDGHPPHVAVSRALGEIGPAMGASSLSTIVTFVPLALLSGVTGQFFAPLAITIVIALSVSLLLSMLVAPVLSVRWLRSRAVPTLPDPDEMTIEEPQGRVLRAITRFYGVVLGLALRRKAIFFALLVAGLAGVYLLSTQLESGFMPDMDEGGFVLDYKMPPGTSLAETDRMCRKIETILLGTPDIQAYSRRTGARLGFGLTYAHAGDFLVRLQPRDKRSHRINEVMDATRDKIHAEIPGIEVEFAQILQDLIGDLAGTPNPVEVRVYGDDARRLQELAPEVGKVVSSVKGVVDENDGVQRSGPEIEVQVDKQRAAAVGMTPETVSAAVNAAMLGDVVTTVVQGGERQVGVRVWYRAAGEQGLSALRQLRIVTPTGASVPLATLATVSRAPGSTETDRQGQRPVVSITAGISGRDLGSVIRDVKAAMAKLTLPPGYTVEYGGLYESQQESFREMAVVLGVVVMLVFCVLLFYFRSFAEPIALFGAAGASLSGVVIALYLTHTPLNIGSITGAVMIIGIVTENGIFLFDYTHQMGRHFNMSLDELLIRAGQIRLRPKLMTILTAILTLFPLALGVGAGAEMQRPLAIAVIGGLSMSTLFTLVLAPTLYSTLLRGKYRGQVARLDHAETAD